MIYLNQEATKFIYPYLLESKRNKNGIVKLINSENENEIMQLKLISETILGIKFALEIPNLFRLTMLFREGNIIAYKCKDAEHYPKKVLHVIEEVDLIKSIIIPTNPQFVFKLFADALCKALFEAIKNDSKEVFNFHSFNTIRFLFLMLIAESPKITSWGTHDIVFSKDAIEFNVQGHHFKGSVKIDYNADTDLFNLSFVQNNIVVGERKGIDTDSLIEYIDKKVEYVETYGEN